MKGAKLSQPSSTKEIERRSTKMAVERSKNSSVIHFDGNRVSMLNPDQEIINTASKKKAKSRLSDTMWSKLPGLRQSAMINKSSKGSPLANGFASKARLLDNNQ